MMRERSVTFFPPPVSFSGTITIQWFEARDEYIESSIQYILQNKL